MLFMKLFPPGRVGSAMKPIMVLFVSLLLAGGTARLFSQPQDQLMKLRLAQSYEQAGNFEQALRLFNELYTKDSSNVVYFDGMRRSYLQLKKYDEAAALIRRRLAVTPGDVNLIATLGSVYYKAGEEARASEEWERAIAVAPQNGSVYRAVASMLVENRLLDKAAEVYRRARTACNDPNLFTIELAQLLAVTMDYGGATAEYLRWLRQNPMQLGFVQGRMTAYTGKEEGRLAAVEAVKAELRRDENLQLYQLLGWLYLEGKKFADALDVYRKIDQISKAHGGEIYGFAERALKEHAFEVAARAYREAIDVPVSAARMPYAKYGYASALKELSGLPDSSRSLVAPPAQYPVAESQTRYAEAIDCFRQVIKDYPRSEFSARSYYQIGLIQFEKVFDLDASLASFEQVEREFPGAPVIRYDVGLKIGAVLEAKGDTAKAAIRFRVVAGAPDATPDQQDEATYRLAELAFYGGRVQQAMDFLNTIALNLKADYANDALLLLSFLQENLNTTPSALAEYGAAEFLARQQKNTEAIAMFLDVIEKNPRALLVDDALLRVGTLQTQTRRYADALASYDRLLTQFKESSIALDRAQFSIGEIYQFGLNDKARAIAAYEKLLANYPQSLLVELARKRIRELRGDAL